MIKHVNCNKIKSGDLIIYLSLDADPQYMGAGVYVEIPECELFLVIYESGYIGIGACDDMVFVLEDDSRKKEILSNIEKNVIEEIDEEFGSDLNTLINQIISSL